VLGDFNIDKRGDNDLFRAFTASGLMVPSELMELKTTYGKEASHYDQIAWFMGMMDLMYAKNAGAIDFVGAVYKELKSSQLPSRVSDHFPIWVEFSMDRSTKQMAKTLGVDPAQPNPFEAVPN
jgi:endonuclease/exonuclease/phosphatase family metal-dependent hydrolase